MASQLPLLFGQIAVELNFVTQEQVKEALGIQKKMRAMGLPPKKIGEILVEKKHMDVRQALKVFDIQVERLGYNNIKGYRLLSKLGHGSMGTIFKAKQLSMDRVVALKILSPRLSQNARFVDRFLREARAVAKVNHPNIVQGIDVGQTDGVSYFAMEFIDGPSVKTLLDRGGAIDEKRALRIIIQIARALDHIHKHGLIHRDIKPDNIMINSSGVAKLCDLGLAKMTYMKGSKSASRTAYGGAVGTPNYISPEAALGDENCDIRSDIYSLGATLYHMVTGEVPFPGNNAAIVISRHISEPLTPPNEKNPLVSKELSWVIQKMMEKDRNKRYQTPSQLLEDLERVIAGNPPLGMPGTVVRTKFESASLATGSGRVLRRYIRARIRRRLRK